MTSQEFLSSFRESYCSKKTIKLAERQFSRTLSPLSTLLIEFCLKSRINNFFLKKFSYFAIFLRTNPLNSPKTSNIFRKDRVAFFTLKLIPAYQKKIDFVYINSSENSIREDLSKKLNLLKVFKKKYLNNQSAEVTNRLTDPHFPS